MATKTVANVTTDTVTLLNGIASDAGVEYQSVVPIADGTNTFQVGQAITSTSFTQNAFLDALVNRIGLVMFKTLVYTNPLKIFKQGTLDVGEVIQEIHTGLVNHESYSWDSGDDSNVNPFTRQIPDVKAYLHKLNVQETFYQTISYEQLTLAFTNPNGVHTLVDDLIQAMYSTFEIFEWNNYKSLFNDAYKAGVFYKVEVNEVTDETTAKELVKKARVISSKLTMPSTLYNSEGRTQTTRREDQVVLITSEVEATLDVDVLASAFNMNKTEFLGQVVVIDDFGEGMEDVQMLTVSRKWFMVYDKLFKMESEYNPKKMYWNYFLNVWMVFSCSPVENAVAFIKSSEA